MAPNATSQERSGKSSWAEIPRADGHSGVILLTGVTGFVGKRLLAELLDQTTGALVCLVRAADELEAQRRGRAISRNLRVVFLPADIEKPQLGLTDTVWEMLANRITEIYHCAASVRFDLSLEESQRINVGGTRTLLTLAKKAVRAGHFSRFHHVSTAYVAGKKRGLVDSDYLPDHQKASRFRNAYEQSKAEAESLLRNQSVVAVTIYRPSIVAGDTRGGATDNFNVLYVPMRLIHRGAMPFMPAGGTNFVDCVGVDYVVRGIVALGKTSAGQCDSFHLTTGKNHFNVQDLVRAARSASLGSKACATTDCKVVSRLGWNTLGLASMLAQLAPLRFRHLRRWGKSLARLIRGFEPYEPYTNVNTIFDCTREDEFLSAMGICQPPPLDYLKTIAEYAVQVEFGASLSACGVATESELAAVEGGSNLPEESQKPLAAGLSV